MPDKSGFAAGARNAIDAHVHVWTPDTERYPLAAGFTAKDMQPVRFRPDELLAIARPAGVGRVVLIQMVFYGSDNAYMLDCMRQYPGVFAGVAQIDERGADPAGELRRLAAQGVRGVRITPLFNKDPKWLEHEGMRALWRAGAEEQVAMCPLINPSDLPAVGRMCEEFPETPVVIDHCARIGGDGVIRDEDLRKLCWLSRFPATYVKLSAFYFLGRKEPPYKDLGSMIRHLCDTYGPERLMWGSDAPYQLEPPHSYTASLELIRTGLAFLSDCDKQWILARTAGRVFFDGA